MGSNDNDYDDGAAIKGASEEEYMTGGTELLEFEQEHFEDLRDAFVEEHEGEFHAWAESEGFYYDQGQANEEHDEFFGGEGWTYQGVALEKHEVSELHHTFAVTHADWDAFVSNAYNNRGNE